MQAPQVVGWLPQFNSASITEAKSNKNLSSRVAFKLGCDTAVVDGAVIVKGPSAEAKSLTNARVTELKGQAKKTGVIGGIFFGGGTLLGIISPFLVSPISPLILVGLCVTGLVLALVGSIFMMRCLIKEDQALTLEGRAKTPFGEYVAQERSRYIAGIEADLKKHRAPTFLKGAYFHDINAHYAATKAQ
jgi:hypothetical protein